MVADLLQPQEPGDASGSRAPTELSVIAADTGPDGKENHVLQS